MILTAKLAFLAALLLVTLIVAISLRRASNDRSSKYDAIDLLLDEKGRASGRAHVMFGAFFLSAYLLVYLALRDKLTPEYFWAFLAAFVAPTVAKFAFHKKGEA